MTQRPTLLRLPAPCTEPWATMTPTAAGRHCAACCTEVVDFTQKSPAEILAHLRQAGSQPVCGRVYAAQVTAPVAAGRRWGRWVGTLLTASSLGTALLPGLAAGATLAIATRPAHPARPRTALLQQAPAAEQQQRLAASKLVARGVVLDARTHTPAAGVTVLLKNTNWATSTNAAGEFALTVVPRHRHVELLVTFVGYKTFVKKLSVAECQAPITLLLEQDTTMLGLLSTPAQPRS